MKKFIIRSWIFLALLIVSGATATAQLTIVSGVQGGSYHRFAKDIKGIADSIEIEVKTSNGSLANFAKLIAQDEMNVTFLQEDVLVHQQLKDLEDGTDNIENINILLPLGYEEIHLVVRADDNSINSLEDLDGKNVVVGTKEQGTYITSNLIKEMTNSKWKNVEIPFGEVFDALEKKKVDAFFFVGSAPVGKLAKLSESENYKLIPLTDDRLEEIYDRTVIPKGTYTWADQDIETFSLRFVMATNAANETPQKRELIKKLLISINDNLDKLRTTGHPKWKEVDVENDFDNIDWKVYEISEMIFNPPPTLSSYITLYSGLQGGSYFQFANDIRKICDKSDSIKVRYSNGSVDNLNQLIKRTDIFVTFLQYDVLLQQRLRDLQDKTNYTENIRVLLPIGDEEIHLVTRKDENINSLKDLKGKKVGIGTIYQGTYVTAGLIKRLTKVDWIDVPTAFDKVYLDLVTREIDAFFFVGSAPVSRLFYLTAENKIKLVPITHKKLEKLYQKTTIKSGIYKWQKEPVETYAVRSVLATNIEGETAEQHKNIQKMLISIKNENELLKKHGHRKWREVNFDFDHLDWETYEGSEEIMKTEISEKMLKDLNYSNNLAKKLDVVEGDTLGNVVNNWFYIRLLLDKAKQEYVVLGNGSRIQEGSIKNFEDGLLWGIERKQLAIGPFLDPKEAQNARMMYQRKKPRVPESIKNAKEDIYWFYISVGDVPDKKTYDLKEMPSKVDVGTVDDFLDVLYRGMGYGLLVMGPYWDKAEAERAERVYRKHE